MAQQYQRESGFANDTATVQYQAAGVFVNAPAASAISGTASLTTAASALAASGTETFSATGSLTSAAASLDISAQLLYNGIADWTSAAASLSATGTTATTGAITGVGSVIFGPAAFRARGRRQKVGGHDVVDLARYNAFVSQGEAILEELGQTPAPTGASAPVLDPVPLPAPQPQPRPSAIDALATALQQATLAPPAAPALRVKGKAWVKGRAALSASPVASIGASGSVTLQGRGYLLGNAPAALRARATVDNFYTIRQRDEQFIEEFLVHQILAGATSAP